MLDPSEISLIILSEISIPCQLKTGKIFLAKTQIARKY